MTTTGLRVAAAPISWGQCEVPGADGITEGPAGQVTRSVANPDAYAHER